MKISNVFSSILKPPDRFLSRLIGKGFGLKDVFTLVNLLGGVAGIILAMQGRTVDASYAVLLGFILGDSLDGAVARLTGHSNKFGSDFDTITDHLAQCIAPAVIVAAHFYNYNIYLSCGLAFLIIAAGSIRHARNTAVPFSFPFCWKGLPRPIATMVIFAFLNGKIISVLPSPHLWGLGLIIGVSYGLLTDFPFVSHHGRKLQPWVVFIVTAAYAVSIVQGLFFRTWFWDTLLLFMSVYIFLGWIVLSRDEMKLYKEAVDLWREKLSGDGGN
ncbi:MAG: CDP-alcohol phosphatidyltransferase family protein [Deltaproteobacteria bacterium]|nr:CDP-alcohol phosphatidyltransferase family protein [Deltaproteobacteria bacterium]